ncbi:fimbrial biogenesis chaperone [Providencia hangzhouensis]|uniref:fimbrial biogenesis chaperone n=1 Tax=Providencia hangzhouensis TaxID=3031799 RepID=UPI002AB5090B|nr:molecular chaperone [Providencia rettgeri]
MKKLKLIMSALILISTYTHASISVDRTRVIYDEASKGVSVVIENIDKKDPYLVQSWIENENGEKISEPLIALPLLQRVEANQKKQIRISLSKNDVKIPNNQESLFYFNVLGIPPKTKLENAVEIVIQSRFKLFYRPNELKKYPNNDWQKELKVEKVGKSLILTNPTPYHIIVINVNDNESKANDFKEIVVKPNSNATYLLSDKQVKSPKMIVTYIDDYGTPNLLKYTCNTTCSLSNEKDKR